MKIRIIVLAFFLLFAASAGAQNDILAMKNGDDCRSDYGTSDGLSWSFGRW